MKIIVWDVDDVLNDLMRVWFEKWWLPSHKECSINYEQISENPPHRLLGVSKSEYLKSLDEFRLSKIAREIEPVPEVLAWFQQYGARFWHIALTATPIRTAHVSAAWVMEHFGFWIRSFNLVPSYRDGEQLPVYDPSKYEYLKWWAKADILVEDNPANILDVDNLGIKTILIPRPWNGDSTTIENALDCLNEILAIS